jgi:sec-independent protein translocase protein TatA
MEIAIVLIIALVIFGPSKLPELGKSAGKGFREFKDSITGGDDDDEKPRVTTTEADAPERVDGEVVASRS